MNIFRLHNDPKIAAEQHCDLHSNKMFAEYNQLLSTCFTLDQLKLAPKTQKGTYRKHFNPKHPSSRWLQQSKQNYLWLIELTKHVEQERLRRGFKPHFTSEFFQWVQDNLDKVQLPNIPETPLLVAISNDSICRQKVLNFDQLDVVKQYRYYYIFDKPFAKWKLGNKPEWMTI